MEDQNSGTQPPDTPATATLWTIEDVARNARCSIRHVTTLRHQGLPHRIVRFSPDAVKRWLED